MKLFGLIFFLVSFSPLALATKGNVPLTSYQHLCAKESDPVKRQQYCYLLENHAQPKNKDNIFRLDVALA